MYVYQLIATCTCLDLQNSNVMNDSITKLYGKSRSENSGETSGGTKLTWKPLPAQTAAAPPSEKVAEESTEPPTVSSEGSPLKTMKEKQPADPESSQEAVPRLQRKRRVRDKTKSLERAAGAHLQEKTSSKVATEVWKYFLKAKNFLSKVKWVWLVGSILSIMQM